MNAEGAPGAAADGREWALHPYWVLLIAILLPGFGHVVCGQPKRGRVMQMFMIVFAIVTWHLTPPDRSLIGRLSGGLFVYALSVPEAYRLARLRWLAAKGGGAAERSRACINAGSSADR